MKLAVIGCGSMGTRHCLNALALGATVSAWDIDAGRVLDLHRQHPEVKPFALLNPVATEFDAVIVATPYDKHLEYVRPILLDRRIPVFVEKPLGSLAQLDDWRALVKASDGVVTQVGYQCRFHPKARAMKVLFGSDKSCRGHFACHVDMRTWPGSGYGPPWLEASHELDLMLWLGAPDRVTAISGESVQTITLGGPYEAWYLSLGHQSEYFRKWEVQTEWDRGACTYFRSPADLGDQMYVDELDHFLTCVRSGRQTDVPLADGLRVLEVCAQIEAMAKVQA